MEAGKTSECVKCSSGNKWCDILIRVLLAALFIYAGYNKLGNIAGTAGFIGSVMGVSAGVATFFAWASGLLELIAGILLATGYFKRYAAWALIIFTLVATYFFHLKVALAGGEGAGAQWTQMLKNLAVVGGLALLAGCPRCGHDCTSASCESHGSGEVNKA